MWAYHSTSVVCGEVCEDSCSLKPDKSFDSATFRGGRYIDQKFISQILSSIYVPSMVLSQVLKKNYELAKGPPCSLGAYV